MIFAVNNSNWVTQIIGATIASRCHNFRGFAKGWFPKGGGFGGCSPGTKTGTRVRSPKPLFWKPPIYLPMTLFGVDKRGWFPKGGGFGGCSPGTKTGTRVRSPKPPFYETAHLSPSEICSQMTPEVYDTTSPTDPILNHAVNILKITRTDTSYFWTLQH